MPDAKVIPFPTRDVGTDDLIDVVDEVDEDGIDGFDLSLVTAGCEDCGRTDGTHDGCDGEVTDPDVITEADGRWVWEPVEGSPEHEPPVGMVAHRIATMCKWTYQHIEREESIPQPCCYSVLITTKRLPGEVRSPRSWLAPTEEEPPS
jgi:hypothetical protein